MATSLPSTATVAFVKSKLYKGPPSSMSNISQPGGQSLRGRRQDSEQRLVARVDGNSGDDKEYSAEVITSQKHRKRKRSRKGLDKNFFCPQEDCGKSYSRAEHLYRHQLNRKYLVPPKARLVSG